MKSTHELDWLPFEIGLYKDQAKVLKERLKEQDQIIKMYRETLSATNESSRFMLSKQQCHIGNLIYIIAGNLKGKVAEIVEHQLYIHADDTGEQRYRGFRVKCEFFILEGHIHQDDLIFLSTKKPLDIEKIRGHK